METGGGSASDLPGHQPDLRETGGVSSGIGLSPIFRLGDSSKRGFPPSNVEVEAHGNVLTAISYLHGLAAEELREQELKMRNPGYEVVITVRAVKPGAVT